MKYMFAKDLVACSLIFKDYDSQKNVPLYVLINQMMLRRYFATGDIFIPLLEEKGSLINYIMNKNYGGEKIVQNMLSPKHMRLISS